MNILSSMLPLNTPLIFEIRTYYTDDYYSSEEEIGYVSQVFIEHQRPCYTVVNSENEYEVFRDEEGYYAYS